MLLEKLIAEEGQTKNKWEAKPLSKQTVTAETIQDAKPIVDVADL